MSEVLEVVHNGMDIAILDTSAACHMPDMVWRKQKGDFPEMLAKQMGLDVFAL